MLKNAKNRQRQSKTFWTPKNPFLCQGPPNFLSQESVPYIGLCSCQISDHLNNSLWIRFEHLFKKQSFWEVLASRLQTKPEISPKIGAKSKALTIWLQPYITLPYLLKKSGISVDVKVDVKNVTEGNRMDGTRLGFLLEYQEIKLCDMGTKILDLSLIRIECDLLSILITQNVNHSHVDVWRKQWNSNCLLGV